MKSIGIDIGSYSIKVAEVSQTKRGLIVHAIEEHLLGQNPAFDNDLEVIELLRSISLKYDPANVKFVVGLRQEFVSQRLKVFPFQDRLKISKSLPFELEEETPFSSENAVFDYKYVQFAGPISEILAFVAPKVKVKERLEKFESFNFQVNILTTESMGLANIIETWEDAAPTNSEGTWDPEDKDRPRRPLKLLIHLGHSQTHVAAYVNDRLASSRTLLTGMKAVTEGLMKRYEIPYQNALAELNSKAFVLPSKEGAGYDQIIFSDTIALQLRELTHDIRMAMLELQSDLHGDIIQADITGGGAQIINLAPYFTTQLEIACNIFDWKSKFVIEQGLTKSLEYTGGIAVGLSIESFKKPRNPAINFRRGEFALQNKAGRQFWETWGGSLKAGAALFVIFFAYAALRDSFSYTLAELTLETLKDQAKVTAGLQPKQANEAGVRKYIKSEKDRIRESEALLGVMKMNSAIEVIKLISDAMPAKDQVTVQIKKLFVEDESVILEGITQQGNGPSLIEQSVKRISKDGKVQMNIGSRTSEGQGFSMQLKVNRGISKVVKK